MMATVPRPSSLVKMILARHTCFCAELPAETIAFNRTRSAAETSNVIPVRIQHALHIRAQIGIPSRTPLSQSIH